MDAAVQSSSFGGLLDSVASASEFSEAAGSLIDWARDLTGCQAGMVRLREKDDDTGDWIPAVVERGYGCRFLREEVLIGSHECMCGRVSCGRTGEDFPFFTPGGSFSWGKVQSIADDFPVESLGNIRGRCIAEGFQSVAIIPVGAEGASVGCLHLADSARDKFVDHVATLEEACRLCEPLLQRFSAQEREVSLISAVETALAPAELPSVSGLELAVTYTSATTAARIGGDFYDVLELEGGDTLLVVGDYCGKGLGAAGMAARARYTVEDLAGRVGTLEELFAEADKTMSRVLPPDRFVTLVACRYSPDGRLVAAAAGHPFPVILGVGGQVDEIQLPTRPPLGVSPEAQSGAGEGRLLASQTLLMYTDGITESRRGDRFFGLEGIAGIWRERPDLALGDLTATICSASACFHDQDIAGDDRLALAARVVGKASRLTTATTAALGAATTALKATVVALAAVAVFLLLGSTSAWAGETLEPGSEIDCIPTREKVVALTFDDAWKDASLEKILDILKEAGIKATFFPTGKGVESNPELARRVAAEGHDIGSHSYSHSKLEAMTSDELVSQIQWTEEAFAAAGLKDPVPLFRAPWGEVNSRVLEVLGEQGYTHIMWTARGGDNVANRSAGQVVVYIMASMRPGAIVVMHSNNDVAPKALPELIRRLKAKGYRFVTLSEALLSGGQALSRYQQTSPWLTYVGEWAEQRSTSDSGGTIYRTDSKGATVAVEFTGTVFELMAGTGPDMGKAWVIIDGGAAQEVDLYGETERHRVAVFVAGDLADGEHIALIRCAGLRNPASAGHSINIDALQVSGWLTQATQFSVPILTGGWDLLRFLEPSDPVRSSD